MNRLITPSRRPTSPLFDTAVALTRAHAAACLATLEEQREADDREETARLFPFRVLYPSGEVRRYSNERFAELFARLAGGEVLDG